jgi:SNF2 family DNA or RNA helicase
MGVGWTLTAADLLLFIEEVWVPGDTSQAEDRLHRIGQTESVYIIHLVFENSLAEKKIQRVIEKQEVLDKALDEEKK